MGGGGLAIAIFLLIPRIILLCGSLHANKLCKNSRNAIYSKYKQIYITSGIGLNDFKPLKRLQMEIPHFHPFHFIPSDI